MEVEPLSEEDMRDIMTARGLIERQRQRKHEWQEAAAQHAMHMSASSLDHVEGALKRYLAAQDETVRFTQQEG